MFVVGFTIVVVVRSSKVMYMNPLTAGLFVTTGVNCDRERGEVVKHSEDRVSCEDKGWDVKRGEVVELSDYSGL